MKFTTVMAVGALSLGAVAQEQVVGEVSASTKSYGRFNKTSKSKEPDHTGTKSYGRFNHTSKSKEPDHTGTKSYGRFNHTSKSKEPDHTGTKSYGRFNHTSKSKEPDHTGTKSYGRFNNTHKKDASLNAANVYGAGVGSVLIAGLSLLL